VLDEATEPLSGRSVKEALALRGTDHPRDRVGEALRLGIRCGEIHASTGERRAILHRRNPLRRTPSERELAGVSECPAVSGQCPPDSLRVCPAAYIEPDTRTELLEALTEAQREPHGTDMLDSPREVR
jgi:hypothetical protein